MIQAGGKLWTAMGASTVMLLWALCFPLINIGLVDSPPLLFATLRACLAGVFLLALAAMMQRPAITGRAQWLTIGLVGVTLTGLGFFGMFFGGGYVSPGLATVLAGMQPLIASVLGWLVLAERLTGKQIAGMLLGFIGIVVVVSPNLQTGGTDEIGAMFIALAALGVAVGNVGLKRIAGRVDPIRAMGWQLIVGGALLGAASFASEDWSALNVTARFLATLLAISTIGTAGVFWLWCLLLGQTPLAKLNVYSFLTPVFGLAIGALFFAERLPLLSLLGVALSISGIWWVNTSKVGAEKRQKQAAPS